MITLDTGVYMNNLPKPKPNERPVLKQGNNGDWTVFLQDALNGCGYQPLDLDGDFGPQTLARVNQFQKDLGLTVDGIIDASMWTALDNHKKLFGWQAEWPGSLSLTGIGGVDTLEEVKSSSMIQEAAKFMKESPRFWGRYFYQGKKGDGEYIANEENKPLHDAGIRVLPISRQTSDVNGNREKGLDVGRRHAADVLATFGEDYLASQGDSFYIFLDVEGLDEKNPPLSKEFYLGWSKAIVDASNKIKLLPCVYTNAKKDQTSKQNLSAAMKEGAQCHGLWVANYGHQWRPQISPWNAEEVKPVIAVPCKVLLHQYNGDKPSDIYDFNQINPFLDNPDLVLQRLILPPIQVQH